jgi:hypothetical protein
MFKRGSYYKHNSNLDVNWMCVDVSSKENGVLVSVVPIYNENHPLKGTIAGDTVEATIAEDKYGQWSEAV